MRLLARTPVRWPTPEQFDLWWSRNVAYAVGELSVDGRGFLRDPRETSPIRLVAGRLAEPGSRYVLEQPGLTAELEGRLDEPRRRLLLTYRPPRRGGIDLRRRGDFVLDVDALDSLRTVTLSGEDPYVAAEGRLRPQEPVPFEIQVRLRWLRVHYVVRREPASGGGEDLVLDLDLVARRAWRLPAAPILALAHRFFGSQWQAVADDMAASIATVTDGTAEPGPRPSRLRDGIDMNLASIELRIAMVLDDLDARPWWRRTGRALRQAHARLPVAGFQPWLHYPEPHTLETTIVQTLSRLRHGRRRQALAEALATQRRRLEERAEWVERAVAESVAEHRLDLTDEALDWSWLASPISVIRWLRTQGISESDLAPSPDPAGGPADGSAGGSDADLGAQ